MMNIFDVLLITNKGDITTDFIVKQLSIKKVQFYRFNTDELGKTTFVVFDVVNNKFELVDEELGLNIDLLKIKSVYFRRPEIHLAKQNLSEGQISFVRSEIAFTLEGLYKILNKAFWINDVFAIRNAENKIFQLITASQLGFVIPNSLISNLPAEALAFFQNQDKKAIIKPIKCGLVEGAEEEGVIFTNQVLLTAENACRIRPCPTFLQSLIEKQADIRVTVVSNKVFATLIESQASEVSKVDWRRSQSPLNHLPITLPDDIVHRCIAITKRMNLVFSAIDLILDKKGNYIFLEINPNGQWAWIEKQTNYNISEELAHYLIE